MKLITGLTFAVITVLLLLVYRSIATTLLILPIGVYWIPARDAWHHCLS